MDLDIYEDLDAFHEEEEKKTAEYQQLEAKFHEALKRIDELDEENKKLLKTQKSILVNFQNLLDTAKTEIKRKDIQIQQLRKEKDDICFRRKNAMNSNYPQNQEKINPFKCERIIDTAQPSKFEWKNPSASLYIQQNSNENHKRRLSYDDNASKQEYLPDKPYKRSRKEENYVNRHAKSEHHNYSRDEISSRSHSPDNKDKIDKTTKRWRKDIDEPKQALHHEKANNRSRKRADERNSRKAVRDSRDERRSKHSKKSHHSSKHRDKDKIRPYNESYHEKSSSSSRDRVKRSRDHNDQRKHKTKGYRNHGDLNAPRSRERYEKKRHSTEKCHIDRDIEKKHIAQKSDHPEKNEKQICNRDDRNCERNPSSSDETRKHRKQSKIDNNEQPPESQTNSFKVKEEKEAYLNSCVEKTLLKNSWDIKNSAREDCVEQREERILTMDCEELGEIFAVTENEHKITHETLKNNITTKQSDTSEEMVANVNNAAADNVSELESFTNSQISKDIPVPTFETAKQLPRVEIDENSNHPTNVDILNSPKRKSLFDKLFGPSPCTQNFENARLLSNVLQILNSDSISTSPSVYSTYSEINEHKDGNDSVELKLPKVSSAEVESYFTKNVHHEEGKPQKSFFENINEPSELSGIPGIDVVDDIDNIFIDAYTKKVESKEQNVNPDGPAGVFDDSKQRENSTVNFNQGADLKTIDSNEKVHDQVIDYNLIELGDIRNIENPIAQIRQQEFAAKDETIKQPPNDSGETSTCAPLAMPKDAVEQCSDVLTLTQGDDKSTTNKENLLFAKEKLKNKSESQVTMEIVEIENNSESKSKQFLEENCTSVISVVAVEKCNIKDINEKSDFTAADNFSKGEVKAQVATKPKDIVIEVDDASSKKTNTKVFTKNDDVIEIDDDTDIDITDVDTADEGISFHKVQSDTKQLKTIEKGEAKKVKKDVIEIIEDIRLPSVLPINLKHYQKALDSVDASVVIHDDKTNIENISQKPNFHPNSSVLPNNLNRSIISKNESLLNNSNISGEAELNIYVGTAETSKNDDNTDAIVQEKEFEPEFTHKIVEGRKNVEEITKMLDIKADNTQTLVSCEAFEKNINADISFDKLEVQKFQTVTHCTDLQLQNSNEKENENVLETLKVKMENSEANENKIPHDKVILTTDVSQSLATLIDISTQDKKSKDDCDEQQIVPKHKNSEEIKIRTVDNSLEEMEGKNAEKEVTDSKDMNTDEQFSHMDIDESIIIEDSQEVDCILNKRSNISPKHNPYATPIKPATAELEVALQQLRELENCSRSSKGSQEDGVSFLLKCSTDSLEKQTPTKTLSATPNKTPIKRATSTPKNFVKIELPKSHKRKLLNGTKDKKKVVRKETKIRKTPASVEGSVKAKTVAKIENENKRSEVKSKNIKKSCNKKITSNKSPSLPLDKTKKVKKKVMSKNEKQNKVSSEKSDLNAITAVTLKPKKRRKARRLLSSDEGDVNNVNIINAKSTEPSAAPPLDNDTLSPMTTPAREIFCTDQNYTIKSESQQLPQFTKFNDSQYQDIDSRLHTMFQSPPYETGKKEEVISAQFSPTTSMIAKEEESSFNAGISNNNEQTNVTVDETLSSLMLASTSTTAISTMEQCSLNDSSSVNSAVKCVSFNSSVYRIEKISDNVAHVFITRKRRKKTTQ